MQASIEQLQHLYTGVNSTWKLLAVKQGLRVVAADCKPLPVLQPKNWTSPVLVFLACYLLLWLVGLPWWIAVGVAAVFISKQSFLKQSRFKWVKASTIIDSSSSDVFEALMELSNRETWDCVVSVETVQENADPGVDLVNVKVSAPKYRWWSSLLKPLTFELQRYWMLNPDYTYHLVLKSSPDQPQYFEGYVVTELDAEKTAVTMIFNIETNSYFFVEEKLKLHRVLTLGALRNFVMERSFDHKADLEKHDEEAANRQSNDSPTLKDDSSKYVLYNDSRRVPLETRIPGYIQAKAGGIKCVNRVRTMQADLDCQKGLILDLIKRAGKTLMEGKHVVGVSLPVRIFEPRSTLERMVDWWCTLPVYLTNAAAAVRLTQTDPVERLKQVVTFAISGLYYGTRQLKPFNPVLGETFQGAFLDGTEIYIEHTSHHPPVSNFQVIGPNAMFQYRGYYEYKGKLGMTVSTTQGNYVTGKQAGPNLVEFPDGSFITYERPLVKISGLMVGDRLLEYQDEMMFTDPRNELECSLKFAEKPGLFSRSKVSCDSFVGEIRHRGANICTVSGNYLDRLVFDETTYWELATSPIYLPVRPVEALPSDSRHRADLQNLMRGDREAAEQ
jgi:hypothetical protein